MKKYIKIAIYIIFIILFFFILVNRLNSFTGVHNEKIAFRDSISIVNFAVVGDLMCHSVQYKYAATESGYDFSENFEYIKPFLSDADFTIGNLETVFAGEAMKFSGYPTFNSPDEYLHAIKDAGFDFLVTSNNHSLDRGSKGLLRTIEKINESGFLHTGTFQTQEARDSLQVINVNGINFALFSYSYGTNGRPIPKGKDFLINLIDTSLIKSDFQKAKESDVDLIMVYYHFGNEYQKEPSSFQGEIVAQTIKFGADIILGSHPHVTQPVEFFKTEGANLDSGFVAYSLGNFISNQRWRYSDGGPILKFSIAKDAVRDSIFINDISVVPTWVFKGKRDGNSDYVILPSDSLNNFEQYYFMTGKDYQDYKQSYKDIIEIMSSRSNKIKFYSPKTEFQKFVNSYQFILN